VGHLQKTTQFLLAHRRLNFHIQALAVFASRGVLSSSKAFFFNQKLTIGINCTCERVIHLW